MLSEATNPIPPPDGSRELLNFVLTGVVLYLLGSCVIAAIHFAIAF